MDKIVKIEKNRGFSAKINVINAIIFLKNKTMVLCIHTYDCLKSCIYMIDYLPHSYIECQHFHDSPHRNQFSCLIDEVLVN